MYCYNKSDNPSTTAAGNSETFFSNRCRVDAAISISNGVVVQFGLS